MEIQHEQQYIKGFNQGYFLSKHQPELDLQRSVKGDTDFIKGFIAGGKEFEMEKAKLSKLKDGFSKEDKTLNKDQKSFDKDDFSLSKE